MQNLAVRNDEFSIGLRECPKVEKNPAGRATTENPITITMTTGKPTINHLSKGFAKIFLQHYLQSSHSIVTMQLCFLSLSKWLIVGMIGLSMVCRLCLSRQGSRPLSVRFEKIHTQNRCEPTRKRYCPCLSRSRTLKKKNKSIAETSSLETTKT